MCSVADPPMYRGSKRVFFKSFHGIAILKDCPSRFKEPPVTRGQEMTFPCALHLWCFYEDTVGNASFVSSAFIFAFPCCWMQVGKAYANFWHTIGHKIFAAFSTKIKKNQTDAPRLLWSCLPWDDVDLDCMRSFQNHRRLVLRVSFSIPLGTTMAKSAWWLDIIRIAKRTMPNRQHLPNPGTWHE